MHLLGVGAPGGRQRQEGAEKGLFQDEVVLPDVLEEVSLNELLRGEVRDPVGESAQRLLGHVEDVDVGEAQPPGVLGLVGIARAGDEDAEGFIGHLVQVIRNRRRGVADVPAGTALLVAAAPEVRKIGIPRDALADLHQHAVGAPGVEKTDELVVGALRRLLLEEFEAVGRQPLHLRPDVVHLEGEVMNARTAFIDEFPDRPPPAFGGDEFQLRGRVSGGEKAGRHVLLRDGFPFVGLAAEQTADEVFGGIKVGYGDADVIEAHLSGGLVFRSFSLLGNGWGGRKVSGPGNSPHNPPKPLSSRFYTAHTLA